MSAPAERPPENAVSTPETPLPPRVVEGWPFNPQEAHMAAAFVPSPEVSGRERAALWSVVERALATTINPHERRSIVLAGHLYDWELFRPTEPLPPGLVISRDEENYTFVSYDSRELFTEECATAATDRLLEHGIAAVWEAVQGDWLDRQIEIKSAIADAMRTLPEYALMQSFDMQPPPELEERPLPQHVKDERTEQIRIQARRDAHISDVDPMRIHEGARRSMQRNVLYLDEQTMPQREKEAADQDALARARAYFMPALNQALANRIGENETVTQVVLRKDNLWLVTPEAPQGYPAPDVIFDAAALVADQLYPGEAAPQSEVRTELLAQYLTMVYDPHNGMPYHQLVDQAMAEVADHVFVEPADSIGTLRYHTADNHIAQYRFGPVGEFVPRETIDVGRIMHPLCHFYVATGDPGYVRRQRAEVEDDETLGEVEVDSRGTGAGRLIQAQSHIGPLPESHPDEELVIRLWAKEFGRQADPFIPGYRLISRAGSRYGFARDEAGDPYTKATVPLTAEQRAVIHDHCSRLGLTQFAEAVMDNPDLTVEGLRRLLIDNSYYLEPENNREFPAHFRADSLDDFARFVRDGKLPQQCSGATKFPRLLMEELFGKGCTATVAGRVINDNGSITGALHDQMAWVHEGRLYIIDAQPPAPARHRTWQGGDYREDESPLPPLLPEVEPLRLPESALLDPADQQRRHLEVVANVLEMSLQIFFRVPDRESLLERVAPLPETDPVRRAMEFVVLMRREGASIQRAEKLQAYLAQYANADESLRREAGLLSYDPRLIAHVSMAVDQILEISQALQVLLAPVDERSSTTPEGGIASEATIESVTRGIEAALALLPSAELEVARDGLAETLQQLRATLLPSDNPHAGGLLASLETATQALDRAKQQYMRAHEASQRYMDQL